MLYSDGGVPLNRTGSFGEYADGDIDLPDANIICPEELLNEDHSKRNPGKGDPCKRCWKHAECNAERRKAREEYTDTGWQALIENIVIQQISDFNFGYKKLLRKGERPKELLTSVKFFKSPDGYERFTAQSGEKLLVFLARNVYENERKRRNGASGGKERYIKMARPKRTKSDETETHTERCIRRNEHGG